jgi:flagellar basal body-associated protein FliL
MERLVASFLNSVLSSDLALINVALILFVFVLALGGYVAFLFFGNLTALQKRQSDNQRRQSDTDATFMLEQQKQIRETNESIAKVVNLLQVQSKDFNETQIREGEANRRLHREITTWIKDELSAVHKSLEQIKYDAKDRDNKQIEIVREMKTMGDILDRIWEKVGKNA